MENTAVIKVLKSKGRVRIKEGNSEIIEWILPTHWQEGSDSVDGIFLFFELFQIRAVAEQFSEVSLDIVQFATKPTIYHTPVNKLLKNGPILDGKIKFSLVRQPFWNKLLFAVGRPVIMQVIQAEQADFETEERFPLFSPGTKEMFLGPGGEIEILKG